MANGDTWAAQVATHFAFSREICIDGKNRFVNTSNGQSGRVVETKMLSIKSVEWHGKEVRSWASRKLRDCPDMVALKYDEGLLLLQE